MTTQKINWKVRFKNKAFVITFATSVIAFGYQVASMFGVVPKISQDMATNLLMMGVNIMATLGIITDPTTVGVTDSQATESEGK